MPRVGLAFFALCVEKMSGSREEAGRCLGWGGAGDWAGLASLFWGGLGGDGGVLAGVWFGEVGEAVGEDEKRDPGLGDSLWERLVGEKEAVCSRVG